jgi:hypothetical protein
MARAYFYIVDQGPNWTIRFERRNYGMFVSEAAAYSQATEWARNQGKNGHDGKVFTRTSAGTYRLQWCFSRDSYPAAALRPAAPEGAAILPLIPRVVAATALALMLAGTGAFAEGGPSGSVEICRQTGIVDAYTGKPIAIPSGATFVENGTIIGAPHADEAPRIRIATIEAAQIAANAACTVARAQVSGETSSAALRAAEGRRLSPSRAPSAGPAGWPGALYLFATMSGFVR